MIWKYFIFDRWVIYCVATPVSQNKSFTIQLPIGSNVVQTINSVHVIRQFVRQQNTCAIRFILEAVKLFDQPLICNLMNIWSCQILTACICIFATKSVKCIFCITLSRSISNYSRTSYIRTPIIRKPRYPGGFCLEWIFFIVFVLANPEIRASVSGHKFFGTKWLP